MKNLENYGVLEMNTSEIKEIEGGGWVDDVIDTAIAIALITPITVLAVGAGLRDGIVRSMEEARNK